MGRTEGGVGKANGRPRQTAIVYPDGTGHFLGKFAARGKVWSAVDVVRCRLGETEVVVHADEISLDGSGLLVVLERMARTIGELQRKVAGLSSAIEDLRSKGS